MRLRDTDLKKYRTVKPELKINTNPMNKTALELSPEEWKKYNPFSIKTSNNPKHDPTIRDDALNTAQKAAKTLRETFGASKVILFGSLCSSADFGPDSDIDLAAWDISPDKFYTALATVIGMSAKYRIELVDPYTCRPSIREAIIREGKEI
jgi:predicted nucleotidyltransferase